MSSALEHNPRQIKQFINHSRLSAIIARHTGLFGDPPDPMYAVFTPEILGKLLTITLRWPLLNADPSANANLLGRLEAMASQPVREPALPLSPEIELLHIGKQKLRFAISCVSGYRPRAT